MAADAVIDPAVRQPGSGERGRGSHGGPEPREASGLTTRLVLAYVERVGGKDAVAELLERCGLAGREAELRDENAWFADSTRVCLFEAANEVLDDPLAVRRMGEAALELNVGQALKLTLRALGSPRLIYSNIVRANAKFNRVHRMDLLELEEGRARIRNRPLGEVPHHAVDCQYNVGLLSCVPLLFGQEPARVRHRDCIGAGAEACIYEVEWSRYQSARATVAWTGAAILGLGGGVVLAPALAPIFGAGAAVTAGLGAWRTARSRRRRWRLLEARVREQAEVAERLTDSLQDLVSALQLDEVLAKVASNAQAALGGVEFALLVEEAGGLRCRGASELPTESLAAIEAWAREDDRLLDRAVLIDDLGREPELRPLAEHPSLPVGSLCAAPVVYREQPLGSLVALAQGRQGFLPQDIELLQSYASQVAIALTNARLFEAQQELATRDPLTGLLNHREFHETLARELERCRRHGGEVGVVMLDLDDFKLVNDTGGHADGDTLLRRVATALTETSRASDLVFRVGGDEFALVLSDADTDEAETAAARARQAVSELDPRTRASCGIASWPAAGPSKDALLARADASLYSAKHRGAERRDRSVSGPNPVEPAGVLANAHQRERLACASRIASKLAPLLDPEEIARTAVEDLQATFTDLVAVVFRLDEEGILRVLAAAGPPASRNPEFGLTTLSIEEGVSGRAARTGAPALVADTRRDPDFVDHGLRVESGSELAIPIRVDGRVWGVLNLERSKRSGFGSDDVLFADMIGSTVGAAIHRSELFSELEGTFMRTLGLLSDALETKDAYTAAHARQVAELSGKVGAWFGMKSAELRSVSYAALLHDIGKIGIPSEILIKPGPLTEGEFELAKQHSIIGADLLERIPYFAEVHPLVRSAHERWDGSGYPDGLAGEEIPLGARIIGACDAFHAMTSDRPYRTAMTLAEATARLRAAAGTQFDPAVVAAVLEVLGAPEAPRAVSPGSPSRA